VEASFRTATLADEPVLLELMRELYRHEGLAYVEPAAREALRGVLDGPSLGRAVLIELDGAVAGYLVVCFGWSLEFHGRDAFLDELYLRDRFRGGASARSRWRPRLRSAGATACAHSTSKSSGATPAHSPSTDGRDSSTENTT